MTERLALGRGAARIQPQALARVQGVHRPDEVRHWSLEIRQAVLNENLQIEESLEPRQDSR